MLHLQDVGGWVDEPWETPDPDDVEDTLKELMVSWTGTGTDAFWHHLLVRDPVEFENLRRHQMMALGRYGRQPISMWDEFDVTELDAWYAELKELITREGAASKAAEDR